jgi:LacI family transcriptional regulator
MSKLTLEQIAELSGVSRSTVSRVVNNHISVRPDVRRRVLQIIEETGYHPDPAARSLASQRSGIIGLVIPRSVQFLFTDPYYPRLMQGIAQACNTHHYILSLFLFYTEEEEQRLSPRVTRKQLVDGVIVTALPVNDPLTIQLLENDVPFVMIGRPTDPSGISFVDADNTEGAYKAVSHLAWLGRCRIATITGPLDTSVGLDRRQGYLNALNERGYSLDEALISEGDFTETGGYLAMQRLLPHRPDAVFAASDTMAMGALRALRSAGLAVPDDIALVGFDDLPGAAIADRPLTTIRQPVHQLGGQAVASLIDILTHGPQPPRQIVLATQLVIRGSCGAK